ncbi:MAG TPA: mechanosensitive ion channel domain-containing protein [Caulobacteraceae bacterium]|nr:mechanosensitive ion channel domain-containing protein [Caulobacteraceae bacterium]
MSRLLPAVRRILVVWIAAIGLAAGAAADQPPLPSAKANQALNLLPNQPSQADLERLIATLQDDTERQLLVRQLQTMLAAQKAMAAQASPLPTGLVDAARDRVKQLGGELTDAATAVVDMPSVFAWADTQLRDPAARTHWIEIGRQVGLILGAAILADLIAVFALGPPRRRLRAESPRRFFAGLGWIALELLLDALPAAAFATTAFAVAPLVNPHPATEAVIDELVGVMLTGRLILVAVRGLLLAPRRIGWTAAAVSDETAAYLYLWAWRFVVWLVYAYGVVGATWWLGIPGAVLAALQKTVALVATILAIICVLQNRAPVASWIRPKPITAAGAPPADDVGEMPTEVAPPPVRHRTLRLLRSGLADIWHYLAVLYLAGIFFVYALRIQGGFHFLFRGTAFTIGLVIAARLLVALVAHIAERGLVAQEDVNPRFPRLARRARRYLPLVKGAGSAVIWVVAFLAILEIWGVGSFAWLTSAVGRQAAASALSVGITLAISFTIWELANVTIDGYLSGLEPGVGRTRSARLRTLLPLLRNALWFGIMLITALLVLSELDVNIVPLLAGASVIGLAVGIGSQALVKDVITGLFILVEDTIAVGDVVDLGAPHSGVVEAISIRTIKLRDQLGAVHTLPFSEISKVTNLGRDYAYWLIDMAVPYATDPDQVIEVYRSVVGELRQDHAFSPLILGDLEPLGVTAFNPTTIQVQGRVRTLPLQQWKVGREISRRLRVALAASGVPQPSGVQSIGFDPATAGLFERLAFKAP